MFNTRIVKTRLILPLTLASVTAGALGFSAPAGAAPPPPELAPLLQRTSELQISSERFSDEVTIAPAKLPRKLKDFGGLKLKLAGEESAAPEAAAVTTTVLGKTITLRLVNKIIYLRDPSIAKRDGNRPWVALDAQTSGKLFSSNPSIGTGSGLGGSGGGIAVSHFKVETALLKASKNVRSLGASTIDGQAVTGFAGTADPKQIEASHLPAKLRSEVVKSHVKPAAKFEVFLAANGLPVRSNVVLVLGKIKLKASEDVLAINFPIAAIAPPPAAETITAAELEKLIKKKTKKKK